MRSRLTLIVYWISFWSLVTANPPHSQHALNPPVPHVKKAEPTHHELVEIHGKVHHALQARVKDLTQPRATLVDACVTKIADNVYGSGLDACTMAQGAFAREIKLAVGDFWDTYLQHYPNIHLPTYGFIVTGSVSRREPCLWSDFEFGMVVANTGDIATIRGYNVDVIPTKSDGTLNNQQTVPFLRGFIGQSVDADNQYGLKREGIPTDNSINPLPADQPFLNTPQGFTTFLTGTPQLQQLRTFVNFETMPVGDQVLGGKGLAAIRAALVPKTLALTTMNDILTSGFLSPTAGANVGDPFVINIKEGALRAGQFITEALFLYYEASVNPNNWGQNLNFGDRLDTLSSQHPDKVDATLMTRIKRMIQYIFRLRTKSHEAWVKEADQYNFNPAYAGPAKYSDGTGKPVFASSADDRTGWARVQALKACLLPKVQDWVKQKSKPDIGNAHATDAFKVDCTTCANQDIC